MKIEDLSKINTAEAAREAAIDWQTWAGEQSLSYGELSDWAGAFTSLAEKYNLTDEFRENGII